MKLLKELMDNGYINLIDTQKTVLAICAVSATPEQAYETTIGNPNLVSARNLLLKLGYINMNQNQLALTEKGQNALVEYNLIDDVGELTTTGQNYLNAVTTSQQSQFPEE